MPPSTVFSYWRREHRRPTASPVSLSSQPTLKGNGASSPSHLPVINHTPVLTTTIDEGSSIITHELTPLTSGEYSSVADLDPEKVIVAALTANAPSSSSTNLAGPPTSSESEVRPCLSPEERERDPGLTFQSNYSQLSLTIPRPDNGDSDSSKTNSPFRRSFGKGLLNSQSSENPSKRSPTPIMAPSGHFRIKSSLDDSPADKPNTLQKEYKYDGSGNRRDFAAEHAHHKSGKAMLHLLNPMSLLAKRRSSQIANLRPEDMNFGVHNLIPAIPDDYDPRIRGSIVHDFSAPRPRRNLSSAPVLLQDATNQYNTNGNDALSLVNEQKKRYTEYSPVFKEHFEYDEKVLQVENKAYLQSSLLTNPAHPDNEQSVPIFARRLPSRLPDNEHSGEQTSLDLEPQPDLRSNNTPTIEEESDTVEIIPHQPSGLAKHLTSNASRFSFDMNGVESSTQEKLLEEKHKEKEAARKAQAQSEYSDGENDFDDDYLDDDDGLEEKIPGVNADADEDYFNSFSGLGNALNNNNKSWYTFNLSLSASSTISVPGSNSKSVINSHQSQGLVPGPLNPDISIDHSYSPSLLEVPIEEDETGLLSQQTSQIGLSTVMPLVPRAMNIDMSQPMEGDDDDLYFDDGEFGDLSADVGEEKFDESIFDDENSHLYERKPVERITPTHPEMEDEKTGSGDSQTENNEFSPDLDHTEGLKHAPSMASEYRDVTARTYGGHGSEVIHNLGPSKSHAGVLSEHNLEALHNALAKAADETASKDRFERTTSLNEGSLSQESVAQRTHSMDSQPELVSDNNQAMDTLGFEEVFDDFSYGDDDAAFYDDPIIAAANAEALENDDEGFYGQEFGFYAHAHGPCGSELTNGGYFGPRGIEGISRSYSTRGKFREPSLTPITERSEWSTRNSVISLTAHGAAHSNPSLSNPGLAQLVDMGSMDEEMSLSALMKLRRGAWGGSNGSLRSSSASPPPHSHPSSNFTGLPDISPTFHSFPPDFLLGGASATQSPINDSDKSRSAYSFAQHPAEQPILGGGGSQIHIETEDIES